MISVLNTIKPDADFMYKRQGYNSILQTGAPIADGSKLLPFVSFPCSLIDNAVISGILTSICGQYTYDIGKLQSVFKNSKVTFYWAAGQDSGLNVPQGYYYILGQSVATNQAANVIYDAYVTRLQDDDATSEAKDCVLNTLGELSGGIITTDMFKTEPFFIPNQAGIAVLKGSFNESFNESFNGSFDV